MTTRTILNLALAIACFSQTGLAAGDKKQPAPAKDIVFDGELVNADLKDTILPESFRKTYTVKLEKNQPVPPRSSCSPIGSR